MALLCYSQKCNDKEVSAQSERLENISLEDDKVNALDHISGYNHKEKLIKRLFQNVFYQSKSMSQYKKQKQKQIILSLQYA